MEVGIEYDLGATDCATTAAAPIAQAMMAADDYPDDPADINLTDIAENPDFDDLLSIVCSIIEAGGDPAESVVVLQALEDFLYPSTPMPTSAATPVYTVIFDSQGGSAVDLQTVEQGDKVTELADPTRTDYAFGGWYKESGCSNAWNFATDTAIENITLYAKWMSIDATLSALTVSTGTLNPAFSSITMSYTVELPHETLEVPTVDVIPADPNATKVITQATNLTGTQIERTATLVVTAEDSTTQKTYTVTFSLLGPVHNTTKDTYYDTIQAALNAATSGDTIEASDGTCEESITFPTGKIIILQSVNGASSTIIQGVNGSTTITCNDSFVGTILEGFTITHESPKTGRGIENGETLVISNCIITDNNNSISNYGGGIYNNDGTLTITSSTISGNTASFVGNSGGIHLVSGTVTIGGEGTENTICGNTIDGTATVANQIYLNPEPDPYTDNYISDYCL
ncbi:MAG: InlB B-repeat-containing protein [Atribacterota bacterium]|nr:InlB B-repeat-containing protein [Atribacterota bacterium]